MRNAVGLCALATVCSASRPLTLLDRNGNLGIQSPKNLLLEPDRYVGVGTSAPEELLDVAGDLAISGGMKLGTRAPGNGVQPVRACDESSEGLLSSPSNVASHDQDLRTFFMCKNGAWIPVGEVRKQAPTITSCKDHPHWGVQQEFEMFVTNPESGAPEKIVCHSEDHMSQRPYIRLNGANVTTLQVGDVYVEAGVTVYDDDARRQELANAAVQTSTTPVDTSTPGTYYLQYSASDATGHEAFPVVRTIIVVDPNPPPVPTNVGLSCLDIKTRLPNSVDGVYWVDPANSGKPFQVSCDMTTDGGGWFKLKLANKFTDDIEYRRTFDNFRVAMWQWLPTDPWKKCEDDSAQHYRATDGIIVTQSTIFPIAQNGAGAVGTVMRPQKMDKSYPIGYADADPAVGERSWVEMNAIRSVVTGLAPTTRIVATSADDDTHGTVARIDGRLEGEGSHEVYIYNEQNQEMLLTPGHDGECGGETATGVTNVGSTGFRIWHNTLALSLVEGVEGVCSGVDPLSPTGELLSTCVGENGALPPSFLLPSRVRGVVSSGGGVSFGYEESLIRVR